MFADRTVLEFTKILAILRQYAETDRGKRDVLELAVTDEQAEVARMLTETDEARRMIERYDTTPLDGVLDVARRDQARQARLHPRDRRAARRRFGHRRREQRPALHPQDPPARDPLGFA
ncbi:MAG: hypothetical protein MZU97_11630 [Bacillus subtilis]|nr:hypothetical protein [Bacillus subtilis]